MNDALARRRFGTNEQLQFARVSGDVNPMHLDPIAARRTQAGAPVAHGVHTALWAFDALVAAGRVRYVVGSIEIVFEKFVYVGSEVALTVAADTQSALKVELFVEGLKVAALSVKYGRAAAISAVETDAVAAALPLAPLVCDVGELAGRSGRLIEREAGPSAQLFPHAAANLGAARIDAIVQLSSLVGMICPGLHSIFGSLKIAMVGDGEPAGGLAWAVRTVDERFRMVEVDASGNGIRAAITAFVRRPPVEPPNLAQIAPFVREDEFAGVTALVIGGSRGLGGIAARAIAAGGGRVVITYLVGEAEARQAQAEIGADRCDVLRFDALLAAAPQLEGLEWKPTQLYYFATPRIYRQKTPGFAPERFARLCDFYVTGFLAACTALYARNGRALSAFYPSTVFVDERPRDLTEYAMAKAAGEVLCADMPRFLPGLRVVVRRLPRLLTDQTATVTATQSPDAVGTMLRVVREMQAT